MFDKDGLIEATSTDLSPAQRPYAHDMPPSTDLVETIESFKPTALFGLSTRGGAFDRRVVETMTALNPRPIIFALSNPTAKAECIAEQAYHWSKGTALFAAGVQFTDIEYDGRTFHPGQANNFYIFPAIGLATAERPREIRPWIEAMLYTPEYGHGTTEGIHP
jgi:malate dehydrogenase (oxaloacetate-decarboxylating)(NADP+)